MRIQLKEHKRDGEATKDYDQQEVITPQVSKVFYDSCSHRRGFARHELWPWMWIIATAKLWPARRELREEIPQLSFSPASNSCRCFPLVNAIRYQKAREPGWHCPQRPASWGWATDIGERMWREREQSISSTGLDQAGSNRERTRSIVLRTECTWTLRNGKRVEWPEADEWRRNYFWRFRRYSWLWQCLPWKPIYSTMNPTIATWNVTTDKRFWLVGRVHQHSFTASPFIFKLPTAVCVAGWRGREAYNTSWNYLLLFSPSWPGRQRARNR